jgi:4-diphosphocytidyl-2-C-methyl-D-erythritol kinase
LHFTDRQIALPAFAKINLSLRVLGRRPDGYHEIETVFQTITLHDRVVFSPLDDQLELTCRAEGVPADETNLVHRAATMLRQRLRIRRGARIELSKTIPAGGGLGGGSSDAAAALLGLARLWQVEDRWSEIASIGAEVGADVPYFFVGGTALGRGTGTQVTPLEDAPPVSLIVITPRARVSTAEAYKALSAPALTKDGGAAILPISRGESDFSVCHQGSHAELCNDFEDVVLRMYPEIQHAKATLLEAGARRAMLSGSGSSVYGVFDNEGQREQALDSLEVESGWQVFPCATLARAEYAREFGECALGPLSS